MKVNEFVKQKRKELDMSQEDFGKRFGISHASVSDIERGKSKSLSFEMIEFLFDLEKFTKDGYRFIPAQVCINHNEKPICEFGCCFMCFTCGMGRGQSPHNTKSV